MFPQVSLRWACFCLLFLATAKADTVLAAPDVLQEAAQVSLTIPTEVTARASFVKAIAISWQPVAGAAGYTIEKSATGDAGSFTTLATVPADVNYHRESDLGLSEQVYYRLQATAEGIESGYSAVVTATTSADDIVRIMPLGDSNTEGGSGSGETELPENRIGYRKELYRQLVLDGRVEGYKIDFVGSQQMGQNFQPGFLEDNGFILDIDHAGFGGARDEDIATLLADGSYELFYNPGEYRGPGKGPYLDMFNPDVILLHIGTNQVSGSADAMDDVEAILDQVDMYEARAKREVTVVMAKIIRRVCYTAANGTTQCPTPTEAENTLKYNSMQDAYVKGRMASGDRLQLVDMQDGANIDYRYADDKTGGDDGGDMDDNLHPVQSGYDKMAQVWFEALQSPAISLPVELVAFKAAYSQMGVQLSWSTASERGNDRFEVQRMQEGQPFRTIGTVKGFGTSSFLHNYTFRDAAAPSGQLYYRLRQVDDDGTDTYSKVVAVSLASTAELAAVYPNPSDGNGPLHLSATGFVKDAPVIVTLRDATGRELYQRILRAGAGGEFRTELLLPFPLPKGLHVCELTSSGKSQRLKLLVR